jgi:putative MATE family efflux protein
MLIALASNGLNILLNGILIFGWVGFPALGVRGAALATQIALGFQGFMTLALLLSRRSPISISLGDLARVSRESVGRFVRVTWPAVVEPLVLRSGFMIYVKFITGLGEHALAAHRSAVAIESLSFMPGYGVGVATSAIVGQYLGARRPEAAEYGFRQAAWMGTLMMSAIGLLLFFIPHLLLWPFAPDPAEVQSLAEQVLRISALEQPFMGLALILAGALRGAGDTRSPVGVGFIGVWLVRVPCTYLLAHTLGMGLTGVWITMILDWAVQTVLFARIFRLGKWKKVRV